MALATTLASEGVGMAAAAWLLRGWRPHWRRALWLALAVNLVSHTLFWYALPHILAQYPNALLPVELLVVLAEGCVYAATVARPAWSAWPVSFLLNWASWWLGAEVWRFVA